MESEECGRAVDAGVNLGRFPQSMPQGAGIVRWEEACSHAPLAWWEKRIERSRVPMTSANRSRALIDEHSWQCEGKRTSE